MFCYIYKIIKKDAENDNMIYIGSTIDPKHRWDTHKGKYNNPNMPETYSCKLYKYIRECGGIDEFNIIILEEFEIPLTKCYERDKRENEYIIKYDAVNKLNSEKVGSNWKENWRELRKLDDTYVERQSIAWKKYQEKNRDKLNEKKRTKIPCDICGTLISYSGMARHKNRYNCFW
jgi:ribosomal protein S27AE